MKWLLLVLLLVAVGCRPSGVAKQPEFGSVASDDDSLGFAFNDAITKPAAQPDAIATGLRGKPIFPFAIRSLAYHPNGEEFAVGYGNGLVSIMDQQGEIKRRFQAHQNWTFDLTYSSDGKFLISGGGDDVVQIWDTKTWKSTAMYEDHTDDLHGVALTSDGKWLATASDDGVVLLRNLADDEVMRVGQHKAQVTSVAISKDDVIASSGRDEQIMVWKTRSIDPTHVLLGHEEDVLQVNFSHDGSKLVSASYDKTARVWDVETGDLECVIADHEDWVFSAIFTIDGQHIITASADENLRMFTVDGKLTSKLFIGSDVADLVAHPDGQQVVAGTADGSLIMLKVHDGKLINDRIIPLAPEDPEWKPEISAREYLDLNHLLIQASTSDDAHPLPEDWSTKIAMLSEHGDAFTLHLLHSMNRENLPATKLELLKRIQDKLKKTYTKEARIPIKEVAISLERGAVADLLRHPMESSMTPWVIKQLKSRVASEPELAAEIQRLRVEFVPSDKNSLPWGNISERVPAYLSDIEAGDLEKD